MRGWRAYVNYNGQTSTCRICEDTDHFGKDCPTRKGSQESKDTPMDTQKPDGEQCASPQSPNSVISQQKIMDLRIMDDF